MKCPGIAFPQSCSKPLSGKLTISDGVLTRSVALTGAQLREGQILYTPLFEELTFRLEVGTPDQVVEAESVQVLAWSGKQPADTLTVPPPDSATDTNRLARSFTGAAAQPPQPPAPIPPAKPAGPSPPKPEISKKGSVAIAPAPKSAPVTTANGGKEPPAAKASSVPRTVAVIQPSSSNSVPKQDVVPATPVRAPDTSLPAVTSERPPVTQPAPRSPANTPPSQTTPATAPKPVALAPNPAAPAPKPEAPPVSRPLPAAPAPSLPPPTVAPAAASNTSPAPAAAAPTFSGNAVLPVPVQRVTPALPRNIPTAGSPRTVSVRVMVDSSGSVQNAEVISSTPKGAFGEAVVKTAALDAAKKWTFRPGQLNGKNVAAEYTIDFKFQ